MSKDNESNYIYYSSSSSNDCCWGSELTITKEDVMSGDVIIGLALIIAILIGVITAILAHCRYYKYYIDNGYEEVQKECSTFTMWKKVKDSKQPN